MGRHSGKKCTICPLAIVWHAIRDKTLFCPLFLYGTPSGSKIPPLSFTSCMLSHPGINNLRIRLSTPVVICLYIIAYNNKNFYAYRIRMMYLYTNCIFFLLAGCLEDALLAAGDSPSGTRMRIAPSIGSVQNCVPAQHVLFGLLQHGP